MTRASRKGLFQQGGMVNTDVEANLGQKYDDKGAPIKRTPSGMSQQTKRSSVIGKKKITFDHLEESGSLRRFAGRLFSSQRFESVIAGIIVVNVVYMGWATNYMIDHPFDPETRGMHVVSLIFCSIYTLEILTRIAAEDLMFLLGQNKKWNLFDSFLVAQSLSEEIFYWFDLRGSMGKVSFLRAFRLAKLAKMLRVIRLMRSMREMRLILFSIMGSMSGMFWSFCLILVVEYMFSLLFVQACA